MYKRLILSAVLLLSLGACGERQTLDPKEILHASIDANEASNRYDLKISTEQLIKMDGMSMKQTADIDVGATKDPRRVYADIHIKNPALSIAMGLYVDGTDYYVKSADTEDEWIFSDDPSLEAYFGDSLMMDYDSPNVYLNLLLSDPNKMKAVNKDGDILVSVTEPDEHTEREIAKYLIDSVAKNDSEQFKDFKIKSIDIANLQIVIDKKTSLVKSIAMDQSVTMTYGADAKMSVDQTLHVGYTYTNKDIALPDDLTEMIG